MVEGLDQFCLVCDLPSNSPLFVGGKIMHRGNFKKKIHVLYHSVDGSELPKQAPGMVYKTQRKQGEDYCTNLNNSMYHVKCMVYPFRDLQKW